MSVTADPVAAASKTDCPMVHCFIDGAWVLGEGETKDVFAPATGEIAARVNFATVGQVDAAAAAARRAQPAWGRMSMAARADSIAQALATITNQDEVTRWMATEMGKTVNEARMEVGVVIAMAMTAVEDGRRLAGQARTPYSAETPDRRLLTMYQPIGVAAMISPWNFPAEMFINVAAALVMGNTVVWKPSEWAPFAPQLLIKSFAEALPAGVLNLVYGGPEEGERLVVSPDVGAVCFIGSTAVGERISAVAGVKKLVLELGGNGPLIVLDDANVDAAVDAAVNSCFFIAGQVCTAGERVLVHEAVHDEFVAKLASKAKALKVGNPLDEDTELGPLSDQRILNKVIEHVEDAKAKGAEVVVGGNSDGLFYEATVLTGVTTDMLVANDETFGPVAPIIRIRDVAEAVAIANSSEYGLSMGVFTSSLTTAFEIAESLESGMVSINGGTNAWELNAPFGGYKKSGLGRTMGPDGLREFANVKSISFNLI